MRKAFPCYDVTIHSLHDWPLTMILCVSPFYLAISDKVFYHISHIMDKILIMTSSLPDMMRSRFNSHCPWGESMLFLTHWGWVTHICANKLTSIGSNNGLSPGRRQAIIWTKTGILLIRTLGTIFSEILIKIHIFPFMKMHLKMLSGK